MSSPGRPLSVSYGAPQDCSPDCNDPQDQQQIDPRIQVRETLILLYDNLYSLGSVTAII